MFVLKDFEKSKNISKTSKKFKISKKTIYRWREEYLYKDKIAPIKQKDRDCSRSGRKSIITDKEDFINFIELNPLLNQQEIALQYGKKINKELKEWHIAYAFKKFKITRKKISQQFKESNEKECQAFTDKICQEDKDKIIYIDESYCRKEDAQKYGYSLRGKPIIKKIAGGSRKTIGIIAGLLKNKIVAPLCFEGYCHAPTFEHWFENELAKKIPPEHIFVMDNASIHNKKRLSLIAEKYGHKVFFCPHIHHNLIK